MARNRKTTLVVFSDLHVGSSVGLWPGKHAIEGGGVYEANVYQKWLYDCWKEMVAEVRAMRPAPTLILNGDAIQGSNWRDGQLVASQISDQCSAAYKLIEPLRKAASAFYMVRGTEWHEGKASDDVEQLASALDAVKDPATGQNTWWEIFMNLGFDDKHPGPTAHIAHHVGISSVPWYEATVPLRDSLLLLAELARFGGPNVRVVLRAHRHRCIGVYAPPDIHVWVSPAWQLKTAFAYKRASSMVAQIGYLVLEYDGVDVVVKPRMFPLPGWHVEEPWRPTQKLWNWEQGSERRESWKSMLRRTLRSRI